MRVMPVEKLSAPDAAVMETFVVPRYLSLFGELALEMVLPSEGARMAHIGCRTGYPDRELHQRVPGAYVVGFDPSPYAIELARNKVAAAGQAYMEYREVDRLPLEFASEFSHVLTLHPIVSTAARCGLFSDLAKLAYGGGQVLVGLPLRGSFQELTDLFREYSLKHDDGDLGRAVEEGAQTRPTIETLSEELEDAGLADVDVEIRQTELVFDSGRALVEDPIARLLIFPELRASLRVEELQHALDYLRDAVDKYWSEGQFELSLNVGCASARKPA